MHELSIAHAIVDAVREASGDAPVAEVRIRVGGLSSVVPEALCFAYEVAAEDTCCAGSALVISEVPVTVWCPACDASAELAVPLRFRCPRCETPTADVRSGRELEVASYTLALAVGA